MIEANTVLELAKDKQAWKVARITGYTTAQVNHILTIYKQKPFTVKPIRHGVSRIQGERRQLLLAKIRRIVEYKNRHDCGTVPAVKALNENIPPMVANRWIRNFTATGEL